MAALRFILGDQLSRPLSALEGLDAENDIVLMAEVGEEASYVRHHQQKLVLVFSAMRHFARLLREEGLQVDYVPMDDERNSGSFTGELRRALQRHEVDRVVVTEAGEWRVREMMGGWESDCGLPVEIREDTRFLCSATEFAGWAQGRKALRMEFFYREMRRKTGWLMEGDKPVGGSWNYDAENRKALPKSMSPPERLRFEADGLTREVMRLVAERFGDHFGDLEPFGWPVTREQALAALAHFIDDCLPRFGDYQDAMKSGGDFLFHSLISPCLNLGLLGPREVCEAVLQAYENGYAPLPASEGFIRQVLGWREFVRGLYWLKMPAYVESNHLGASRPLPDFFWTGDTDMHCLRETITATRKNAYAHHIQRLMITGNFALLAGLAPLAVEEWYLLVYADAYEWVELPNTHGMALFADGGLMASKPYAASGAYINRMSDYCANCAYDPKQKLGDRACPFNYLYWNFLIVNQEQLASNARMALAYRNLERLSEEQRDAIVREADAFLARLGS